jgi:hypothetical protein
MGKAEETVKARLVAEAASRAEAEQLTLRTAIDSETRYLRDAIPRLLKLLEQQNYPDARLLSVPGPLRFLRRQPQYVEIAAWLVYESRWSEGGTSIHLLSDGRLTFSSSGNQGGSTSDPMTVEDVPRQYREAGAVAWLESASEGIKALAKRYESP